MAFTSLAPDLIRAIAINLPLYQVARLFLTCKRIYRALNTAKFRVLFVQRRFPNEQRVILVGKPTVISYSGKSCLCFY